MILNEEDFVKREIIKLDKSYNFRDLGGLKTKDKKIVRHGVLYRSDSLSKLSKADLEIIKDLNLTAIVDYRSDKERADNPSRTIVNTKTYHFNPIADLAEMFANEDIDLKQFSVDDLTPEIIDKLFIRQNQSFVKSKKAIKAYRAMLSLLLDEANLPLLQHCTAGKDRTGFGVMLILGILGVSEADIIADYLVSNNYFKLMQAKNIELSNFQTLVSQVKAEYLQSAIDLIKADYGSILDYVKIELGFSDKEISTIKYNLVEG